MGRHSRYAGLDWSDPDDFRRCRGREAILSAVENFLIAGGCQIDALRTAEAEGSPRASAADGGAQGGAQGGGGGGSADALREVARAASMVAEEFGQYKASKEGGGGNSGGAPAAVTVSVTPGGSGGGPVSVGGAPSRRVVAGATSPPPPAAGEAEENAEKRAMAECVRENLEGVVGGHVLIICYTLDDLECA